MTLYCFDTPKIQITLGVTERGEVALNPNPTDQFFHTEKSPVGTRHVWLGKCLNIMLERSSPGYGKPLLCISRIG